MLDGPRLPPLSGNVHQLVILLHGYGSNGADLISLAPAWRAALPDAAFTAPNAPENCPGFSGTYQWWALTGFDRSELSAGAARAGPTLDAFLDAELARHGLSEDRLLLVGFSQGTMMALQVGLRRERPLAGITGYSGAPADGGALSSEIRSRPPVLLVHPGAVLPIRWCRSSRCIGRARRWSHSTWMSRRMSRRVSDIRSILPGSKQACGLRFERFDLVSVFITRASDDARALRVWPPLRGST